MEEEKVEEIKIEEVKPEEKEEKVQEEVIEKEKNGKLIILIAGISLIILIILIILIVSFVNKPSDVVTEKKTGGEVNITYTDKSNTLTITGATPMEDSAAIKDLAGENYFEFSVETKLDEAEEVNYEISISKNVSKSTINDSDIRVYLEKENSGSYTKVFGPKPFKGISKTTDLGTKKGDMVIANMTNKKSIIENYRLKIWLSNTAAESTISQDYSVEINIKGDAK